MSELESGRFDGLIADNAEMIAQWEPEDPESIRTIIYCQRGNVITDADVQTAIAHCGWEIGSVLCADQQHPSISKWAFEQDKPIEFYHPKWRFNGKKAAHLRDQRMLLLAGGLIVVWDGQDKSCKKMLEMAKNKAMAIFSYRVDHWRPSEC